MRFTQLADWLSWLETFHPKSIDFGLERIAEVAQRGQLQRLHCPVITVTGTNGKGSCVALLEQSYYQQGYKTASYTSPHLLHFNERIKLNTQGCSDTQLCEAFAAIDALRGDISLTYFEFTTLAALWIFQQHMLDVVILEVGVGGRLDAVNIVDTTLAIITKISLDHCQWLGNTREQIAYEKAGIMRAKRPVICGDVQPPQLLKDTAQQFAAPWFGVGHEFNYEINKADWTWSSAQQCVEHLPLPQLAIPNAAIVLMALEVLQEQLPVQITTIKQVLLNTQLAGRFQRLQNTVEYIFDVAHNPDSAELLAENLKNFPIKGKTFAIIAMLKDKDIALTAAPLTTYVDKWYAAGLDVARGADINYLMQQLQTVIREPISGFKTLQAAHDEVLKQATAQDRIIVFGSFYTVAAVQTHLMEHPTI